MAMPSPPVFISSLTAQRRHLLLVSKNEAPISRLSDMIVQSSFHIGIISDDLPFLANLSALENIVLGCMYHRALSLQSCLDRLQHIVTALGVDTNLGQRSQFLSRPQLLKMHLLRCIANESAYILLPQPSRPDCDILHRAVERAGLDVFLWVACLSNEQDLYTSLEYPVIDLNTLQ